MTTKTMAKGVRANGEKIKQLRKAAGLSQKGLFKQANVGERTLQRAEQGERVMPEVMSQIARVLQVQPAELVLKGANQPDSILDNPHYELLRHKQIRSASEIESIIRGARLLFACDVDPDADLAEKIAAISEMIEALEAFDRSEEPFGSQVRRMGELNSALNALADYSVYVFVGSYQYREFTFGTTFLKEQAHWCADEFRAVMILFSSDDAKHITRKVYVGPTHAELNQAIDEKEREGQPVYDYRIPF